MLSRFYLYARMMNSNFLLYGVLNSPANGAVDTTAGTTYGKTATYTCNVGFNVQGDRHDFVELMVCGQAMRQYVLSKVCRYSK